MAGFASLGSGFCHTTSTVAIEVVSDAPDVGSTNGATESRDIGLVVGLIFGVLVLCLAIGVYGYYTSVDSDEKNAGCGFWGRKQKNEIKSLSSLNGQTESFSDDSADIFRINDFDSDESEQEKKKERGDEDEDERSVDDIYRTYIREANFTVDRTMIDPVANFTTIPNTPVSYGDISEV